VDRIAIKLKTSKRGGKALILVECAEGDGDIPRNASANVNFLERMAKDIDGQLRVVTAAAKSILEALQAANPDNLEVEFGIQLGGKAGIPMITEGSAKGNLKIKLVWDRSAAGRK
jgi:hypothetical protein